jgi:hypothetical protein
MLAGLRQLHPVRQPGLDFEIQGRASRSEGSAGDIHHPEQVGLYLGPEILRIHFLDRGAVGIARPPLEVILDSNEDKVGRIVAAQREGKVTKTYPAVPLYLARSTALMWHTQIPELASLFPSDRLDRRDMVVRMIRQVLEQ